MKILIVGKGGREHALVEALHDASSRPRLFAYPGNDGMGNWVQRLQAPNLAGLVREIKSRAIDLCVIGEEQYLAAALADQCHQEGIRAWGPVKDAARLETSKIFAKEFLFRHRIPTGAYQEVRTPDDVRKAVKGFPCVLKFDGLAAGKGVSVCFREKQVEDYIDRVFAKKQFEKVRF